MSASTLISAPNDIGPTQGRLWPISQDDYLPRHFWRRLITGGFQALALSALLVAVIAPLFDHHYAQRDPHHAHIYLGALDAASLATFASVINSSAAAAAVNKLFQQISRRY